MTDPHSDITPVWLITGGTSGLGLALVEAALAAGERVVTTARRPGRIQQLIDTHPDELLVMEHDVRETDAAVAVVDRALERFGCIDTLVNNAGVGQIGASEEVGDEQLRDMLAQHLFGPAAFVRAALPGMRERGSGTIVQMSSQGGRRSFPGFGSYSAGKFALEGWSEALAGEVAPFGIRVLIVEPSRFRTGFNDADVISTVAEIPAYAEAMRAVRIDVSGSAGRQEGDPIRGADVIRHVMALPDAPLRLPLGLDAVHNVSRSYRAGLADAERWSELSASADFPGIVRIPRTIDGASATIAV